MAIYVLWTDWRVLTRPCGAGCGDRVAVVVGVSLNYLFLPIRAAQYPPINEGEPVGFFSQALMDVLNRVQYGKPSVWRPAGRPPAASSPTTGSTTLAVRPRLGPARAASPPALFTVLGLGGLWALMQARPAGRARRAGHVRHADRWR